jgi:hypothetical protein
MKATLWDVPQDHWWRADDIAGTMASEYRDRIGRGRCVIFTLREVAIAAYWTRAGDLILRGGTMKAGKTEGGE